MDFDSAIAINSNRKDIQSKSAKAKMHSKDFSGAYEDLMIAKEHESENVDTITKKYVEALANYDIALEGMKTKYLRMRLNI